MATVTVRKPVPEDRSFAEVAREAHGRSMEQAVREIIEQSVSTRFSVMQLIEASWSRQARRPSADEVESWIAEGRK